MRETSGDLDIEQLRLRPVGRRVPPGALRIAAAVGAGILIFTCFPPLSLAYHLPIGIGLLIWAIRDQPPKSAFYLGLLAGFVQYAAGLFWMTNIFGAASIALWAIEALFHGLFCAAYSQLSRRIRLPAWILAPTLWVGVEIVRAEYFPLNFGWMAPGYALAGIPLAGAAASVLGVYGLSWIVVALGTALATSKKKGYDYAIWFLPVWFVWIAFFLIPFRAPKPQQPIHVLLIQAPSEDDENLLGLSAPRPGPKPDVILYPEYSFQSDPTTNNHLKKQLAKVARENQAYLVFGAKKISGDSTRNAAFVMAPDGSILGTHIKNHTLHFFNEGERGTEATPIQTSLGKIGVAICFDMDFPDVARRLAQNGAEVFLVPNMDPAEWSGMQQAQHRLMFQMRAAENGRWLARADVAGGTSAVGPTGRQIARVRDGEPQSLMVRLGLSSSETLYMRGGWLFGPVCLAVTIALLGLSRFRRTAP